jgi:hypothetical protein
MLDLVATRMCFIVAAIENIAKPWEGTWRLPPRCRQSIPYFSDNVIHVGKLRARTNGLERATQRGYAHSVSLSVRLELASAGGLAVYSRTDDGILP